MEKQFVYVAFSDKIISWAKENRDLYVLKVGITADPSDRQRTLNGEIRSTGRTVRGCCDAIDWTIVHVRNLGTERAAKAFEGRIHDSFDKVIDQKGWIAPFSFNGDTEVLIMPRDFLKTRFESLDPDIGKLLMSARAKMNLAYRRASDLQTEHTDAGVSERDRDWQEHVEAEYDDRQENLARAESLREGGYYYD